jgi:nitrous oxide reductase accessory protein NosL
VLIGDLMEAKRRCYTIDFEVRGGRGATSQVMWEYVEAGKNKDRFAPRTSKETTT